MMNPMQMLAMLNSSGNPDMMLQQMAQQNPLLNRAMTMAQGKSPQELRAIAINLAKQQGMTEQDVDNMAKSFGLRL